MGAVADVVSGIVLTYTRAFHMGDRVRIADGEGDVLDLVS
ncbi:MAG: mechanosensitive ion channel [Candidatus Binatia bacterium]|nr:mechanosensitive ion channel [Candidatus Binatia bacterium]